MKIKINLKKIKDFMKANGYNVNAFAEHCAISSTTMRKILSDNDNLRLEILIKVAKGMEIHVGELFRFGD